MKIKVFDQNKMGYRKFEVIDGLSYFCANCGASADSNLELNLDNKLVVNCPNCGNFNIEPVEKTRKDMEEKIEMEQILDPLKDNSTW